MIRETLNEKLVELRSIRQRIKAERRFVIEEEDNLSDAERAQILLQSVAQEIQQEVHSRIAGVVSRSLEAIFDDRAYEFQIIFDKKRGRTEARLAFVRDGLVLDNPAEEVGGGVIDVAAFALRLACLSLIRPPVRKVLILDEPFAKIRGIAYRRRVRDLLTQLSEEMGIQIILNVDIESYPEFELGKVVEVRPSDSA